MKKMGILGGTFDPPHIGHLLSARCMQETLNLDGVAFMPAGQPTEKPNAAPVERRVHMLNAALMDEPDFTMNTIEIDRPGPTNTVDTFEELTKYAYDWDIHFIVGGDSFNKMHLWPGAARIAELTKIVVISRPYHHLDLDELQALCTFDVEPGIIPVSIPLIEISSTDIRWRVKHGLSIKWLVPDKVGDVIKTYGLYKEEAKHG